MLSTSIVSASAAVFVTNAVWESKYLKLELRITQEEAGKAKELYESHIAKYDQVIADYRDALQGVAEIVRARDEERENQTQRYRSLYAQYSQLQQRMPADPSCDIDSERSSILVLVGQESSEIRRRLAATAENKAGPAVPVTKGVPDTGTRFGGKNKSRRS